MNRKRLQFPPVTCAGCGATTPSADVQVRAVRERELSAAGRGAKPLRYLPFCPVCSRYEEAAWLYKPKMTR